jgi:hypothetical protein
VRNQSPGTAGTKHFATGLDQPPLSVKLRLTMEAVLDLLGEQDLGKRLAEREPGGNG